MATAVSDVWMETPDILAFMVRDDAPLMGNIVTQGSAFTDAYDTWVSKTNPRSGNSEFCQVIGADKKSIVFSAQPPVNFVNFLALRVAGNYTIDHGLSITAVYYRDESNSQTQIWTGTQTLGVGCRRTFYLQLSARPTQGVTYTIANSTASLTSFTLAYSDKVTRAGGIKVNFGGHRHDDTFKRAYLCSRLPRAPNKGVVDFAGTYGLSTFSILDANGWVWYTGTITLRRAWNDMETSDGYAASGIDVADMSQSWTVTAVTKGATATVTAPGHPFVGGEKVRFFGMSGMTQLDAIGATGGPLYTAATVSNVSGNNFDVNIVSTGFSSLTTGTYNSSFGGIENQVFQCFNTNRAGTNVYQLDFGSFVAPRFGAYRLYIPGYGVSDPIVLDGAAWAITAAKHHEGTYCQRLGMALTKSATYSRGNALKDGVSGCNTFWSDMPSLVASETVNVIASPAFPSSQKYPSGLGAYAPDNNVAGQGLGWLTPGPVRMTGSRPARQDAGDNDDMGADHLPAENILAQVVYELPPASRFTPFTVDLSSQVLDPALFAGTDALPPVFHEMAWHYEAYRSQQRSSPSVLVGSLPGGWGLGHFAAQVPNFPEPIDYYRGTDAGGSLAGTTVMNFVYASDAVTNTLAAYGFAKFSQICLGYGLTTLGNTYQQAALDAFAWGHNLYASMTARDAYYDGVLGMTSRIGWTAAQKNTWFALHNAKVKLNKLNFYGLMYRILGSVTGQTTYGDFIDAFYCSVAAISNGGGGYAVGDTVTTAGTDPTVLAVTSVSLGVITGIAILYAGNYVSAPSNPVAQASTSGSGTGATFNITASAQNWSLMPGTQGAWEYINTSGAKATPKAYMLGHAFDGTTSSNADYYLSSTTCFNAMIQTANTSGGTKLLSVGTSLQAHMTDVLVNGASAGRSSKYLQSLQAGLAFVQGANLPGKSFTTDFGPRFVECMLHEDAWKLGFRGGRIPGQTIFGYFAWASGLSSFEYKVGTNADSGSNWDASNATGNFEASPNFGSHKMVTPLIGQSYWEWSVESRGYIFPCEFDVAGCSVSNLTAALYLHGWDGNSETQISDQVTRGMRF